LQQFCALTATASTWYYVGYVGCIVVVLGIVHFLICLAANYAHIKDGSKYMELREIYLTEENELNSMGLPIYHPPPPRGVRRVNPNVTTTTTKGGGRFY
jgi:hypothetical protein